MGGAIRDPPCRRERGTLDHANHSFMYGLDRSRSKQLREWLPSPVAVDGRDREVLQPMLDGLFDRTISREGCDGRDIPVRVGQDASGPCRHKAQGKDDVRKDPDDTRRDTSPEQAVRRHPITLPRW
jgi:hypothetical protein